MSNIELTKPFQERIFERIRDSIGDLMSDEDLKKLVDAAVDKAFFEPRGKVDSYGRIVNAEPPWLVEEVTNLLRERVDAAIKAWIEAHPEEINKAIEEVIAKGMVGLVLSYFEQKVSMPLYNFANELRSKGML